MIQINYEYIKKLEQKIHDIIESEEEVVLIVYNDLGYNSAGYKVDERKFYNISKDYDSFVCYDFEYNIVKEDMFLYNVVDRILGCFAKEVLLFRGGKI